MSIISIEVPVSGTLSNSIFTNELAGFGYTLKSSGSVKLIFSSALVYNVKLLFLTSESDRKFPSFSVVEMTASLSMLPGINVQ